MFSCHETLRYEKGSRAIRVNLARTLRWRTDRAIPQQDVHQLYRIAASTQNQRRAAQNQK